VPYHLKLKKSAEKELEVLPLSAVVKIQERIFELANNPFPPGIKKLKGFTDLYRIRVGKYRAIYNVNHQTKSIEILKIGDRKNIYE
jgi:mRNA interferase RelE/StbE